MNINQTKNIRWLVWQGHINGVGRKLGKSWVAFKVNLTGQNLDRSWTGTLLQLFSKVSLKKSSGGIKCHQNFIGLSSKNDHQTTTKTPPELAVRCGRKIGSIRVKSDQKIGANQCRLVQSSSRVSAGFEAKIGANRGESGQILTGAGTKMRVNECKWVQKIGTNRNRSGRKTRLKCDQMLPNATKKQGDQRRLKATKNRALTYHYLILPNNLFMFCVGQKLL